MVQFSILGPRIPYLEEKVYEEMLRGMFGVLVLVLVLLPTGNGISVGVLPFGMSSAGLAPSYFGQNAAQLLSKEAWLGTTRAFTSL